MFLAHIGGNTPAAAATAARMAAAESASSEAPPWARFLSDDRLDDNDASDDADDDIGAVGVEEAPRDADKPPPAKRAAWGSDDDRWEVRCTDAAIQADQSAGCACGCVRKLSLAEIQEQRKLHASENADGRRDFLRQYLEMNAAPGSKFKFMLHTQDDTQRPLCLKGFVVYHGFTAAFVYFQRKKFLGGDRADDPNLGGDACQDDSAEKMAFIGWFKELREDTECMPNSRLRQLDYIKKSELFAECIQDLVACGTHKDRIGSYVSGTLLSLCDSRTRPVRVCSLN